VREEFIAFIKDGVDLAVANSTEKAMIGGSLRTETIRGLSHESINPIVLSRNIEFSETNRLPLIRKRKIG